MDDNAIVGGAKVVGGRIESAAGALFGDSATELRGKVREISGAAQQSYGQATDAVRKVTAESPLISLFTAGAIGLVVGLLLNRR